MGKIPSDFWLILCPKFYCLSAYLIIPALYSGCFPDAFSYIPAVLSRLNSAPSSFWRSSIQPWQVSTWFCYLLFLKISAAVVCEHFSASSPNLNPYLLSESHRTLRLFTRYYHYQLYLLQRICSECPRVPYCSPGTPHSCPSAITLPRAAHTSGTSSLCSWSSFFLCIFLNHSLQSHILPASAVFWNHQTAGFPHFCQKSAGHDQTDCLDRHKLICVWNLLTHLFDSSKQLLHPWYAHPYPPGCFSFHPSLLPTPPYFYAMLTSSYQFLCLLHSRASYLCLSQI